MRDSTQYCLTIQRSRSSGGAAASSTTENSILARRRCILVAAPHNIPGKSRTAEGRSGTAGFDRAGGLLARRASLLS